ncbi:hypothetical protein N2152v2_008242 [Parachlorella kessleri]
MDLASYEQALAARNLQLDAKISQLEVPPQPQPQLAQTVADAVQHLLTTASIDDSGWEAEPAATAHMPACPEVRVAEPSGSSAEEPTSEALPPQAALRLYKARVSALQSEVASLQTQLKDKDKRLDASEKGLRQLQTEKAAWQKQQKALETQVDKLRQATEEATAKLREKENAVRELGRDRQNTLQERRQTDAEMKARNARLGHALTELERYKKLLEQAKAQHAAAGDEVSREDYSKVVAEAKRLEQQKLELVLAFRKAMKLVDVLKRQKLHLEAAALLDISGKELMQAMELGK